jgi:AraC family transcriptional regulator
VLAHVHDHLDEPLDLMTLADVACMSAHHWHRVYHGLYGETLAQTVKRLRLHRAAGQLAQGGEAITRVARAAGYPNLQSFNRTFKAVYGLPPARYRAAGQHRAFDLQPVAATGPDRDVQVCALNPEPALALAYQGSYMGIGKAFDSLLAQVMAAGLARPGLRLMALYHDDPDLVPEPQLRAHALLVGCAPPDDPGAWLTLQVPGGLHAVLTHQGPYASMRAAYQWLYGHWLPRSGHAPSTGPVLEMYLNDPRETRPAELVSQICLPLRAADHGSS